MARTPRRSRYSALAGSRTSAVTSCPARRNASSTAEPIYPVAPVRKMCMRRAPILSRIANHDSRTTTRRIPSRQSRIPVIDFPVPPRETIDVLDSHQFDVIALERYLRTRIAGVHPPLLVRQFRGGQSNPTYYIETSTRRLVLRRKPPGHLLPSAHAIEREYQVMSALYGTDVPVPKTHLLCEDADVIGTPFFVMEYVDGHPMTDAALPHRASHDRQAVYHSMIEILAHLHNIDWRAAGLGEFGRPGNYVARQVHRWTAQYRA